MEMERDSVGVLGRIMSLLEHYLESSKFLAIKRRVWYGCVEDLMKAAKAASGGDAIEKNGSRVAKWYLTSVDLALGDVGTEQQRLARAKAAGAIARATSRGVFGRVELMELRGPVVAGMKDERSTDVRKILKEALDDLDGMSYM